MLWNFCCPFLKKHKELKIKVWTISFIFLTQIVPENVWPLNIFTTAVVPSSCPFQNYLQLVRIVKSLYIFRHKSCTRNNSQDGDSAEKRRRWDYTEFRKTYMFKKGEEARAFEILHLKLLRFKKKTTFCRCRHIIALCFLRFFYF